MAQLMIALAGITALGVIVGELSGWWVILIVIICIGLVFMAS